MNTPILSTYRIQLNPDFDFEKASEQADYFRSLGISHVYCSPYLQPARGSTHGYDVVDHSHVNEELGGEVAHQAFVGSLREAGLGQILDIVPNHMAVSGPENRWWWDVLENGPSSRYADYFDVDWEYPPGSKANQVLLPILGNHYGRIIEGGELRIEREGGMFYARYYDHLVPIDPRSLSELLGRAADRADSAELGFLASALDYLPLPTVTDRPSTRRRHRDKEVIREKVAALLDEHPALRRAVDAEVDLVNSDSDRLDYLLSRQNYRLAYWRIARSDLGYRRFFDINNLIAIRVEDPDVFADTHVRILDWVGRGVVDGLRIDHPDGLRDPEEYFSRLRRETGNAWIVGEKILHPGERLPDGWPIAGTTGYDFSALQGMLMVDAEAEKPMTDFYRSFTSESDPYDHILYRGKMRVIHDLLGSDVNRLVVLLSDVCEHHRRFRDFTREDIFQAISEVLAELPVYRTYTRAAEGIVHEGDRRIIDRTIGNARERRDDLDSELFDLIYRVLTLDLEGESEREFVMRFQQLSGPVMAKGGEDTAFYRYNRLVCLNEVGSDPGQFGVSTEGFHEEMSERARRVPRAMLCTSTHDTKRSEDVRARLAVLSEMPSRWAEAVWSWATMADRHRTEQWPDRNIEYLIYQTLAGAWPISEERMIAYVQKAMRESKSYTTWTEQNEVYEAAVTNFVHGLMTDQEILDAVARFVNAIRLPGYINSLAMTAIKLMAPGVPDIYQGCELWNFSLVDPDNRRPVDYTARRELLSTLDTLSVADILERMEEGLPKLALTRAGLRLRLRRPEVFAPPGGQAPADYRPLHVSGPASGYLIAFSRADSVLCIAPRLPAQSELRYPETVVVLPDGEFRDIITGAEYRSGVEYRSSADRRPESDNAPSSDDGWTDGEPSGIPADTLLGEFPIAILEEISDNAGNTTPTDNRERGERADNRNGAGRNEASSQERAQ
ncbi:MAG: malto-oligosyltrehalose synthase [Spirochaetia bacterium]